MILIGRDTVVRIHMYTVGVPIYGGVMKEKARVPGAREVCRSTMETLGAFIQQHVPRCQGHFICITVKVFNHNGPRFRMRVLQRKENWCEGMKVARPIITIKECDNDWR